MKHRLTYMHPSKIQPYYNNPRKNDAAVVKVAESIKAFGFQAPIIVDKDHVIVVGHTRWKAALKLNMKEVPVIVAEDLTPEKAKAYRIADNRASDFSEWDYELLSAELDDIDDEFKDWFDFEIPEILEPVEGLIEDDEIPEEVETRCKPGDLWQLGRHRLLCGDATNVDDVERLMDGGKVDSLVTDPPYGVDYSSKNEFLNQFDEGNRIQKPINNDAIKDYRQFFSDFLSITPFADYNTIYVFMSGKELHNLRLAIDDCDCVCGDYLVWVKNNHVLGRKDYNSKHEFILYGWNGKHKFYGDFSTTILEFPKPQKSELHPTMKPIELLIKLIKDGSKANAIIYDPFLGSGSTLIAAEKTNRICYGMEIDPHYCDVIIERWQQFTGQTAERVQ